MFRLFKRAGQKQKRKDFFVIAGLGNPGSKYAKTRHNAGVMFVEYMQNTNHMPPFQSHPKTKVLMSKSTDFFLVIPQSFMNTSGENIDSFIRYYDILSSNVIVAHDDKDINLGSYKIQSGKSSAGHRGVKSIIDTLNTQEFHRLRIGIGPVPNHIPTDQFVLERFSHQDLRVLQENVFPSAMEDIKNIHISK